MADNLNNNIFHSFIADTIFVDDVLDKIYNDLSASYKSKGKELTADEASEKMWEYVMENLGEWAIESFINERFEEGDE